MKLKPTFLLATLVVTMGLLLVASAAQAATVITDGDGNVTRIENLEVLDISLDITVYNVDFVYDTAINVYATGFDFPFPGNAVTALEAVTDALNAEDTIPPAAGPQGSDQFFIGWEDRFGRVLAVGGQNIAGVWDQCEEGNESECIAGSAVLNPDASFTYADFTVAEEAPPGKATLISPSGFITENNPTYTWTAVAGATWYNLLVDDNNGDNIIDDWFMAENSGCGDGTGECSGISPTALADGAHTWTIQAENEFDLGPLSDEMSFTVDTTGATPGPATLISPSGSITDNTPTYTWDAVANSAQYYLYVWDSTQTKIFDQWYTAADAGCSDGTGECSVTPEKVLADDSHEWWIQTWNKSGYGPWSPSPTVGVSFTVDTTGATPGPATLVSPSGPITDNTPTYTWNAVANSAQYYLYVWDSTQTKIFDQWYTAADAGCSDGTGECSVTPETVLADDSHEWWIQTWNKSGYGPWSPSPTVGVSFTVNTSSGETVVETDQDGNVTQILNLPVIDENTETTTIYDVDFTYGTVTDVYGSDLDFDFPAPENDEQIFIALAAVNNTLNSNDPIPVGAGPQGSGQYFIGYKNEDGLIVAAGGEDFSDDDDVWGPCLTDPCIDIGPLQTGVAVLNPNKSFTWADFTVVD